MKATPTPPPPDMTREQARELKQLHARVAKIERGINAEERMLRRELNTLDRLHTQEHTLIQRLADKEKKQWSRSILTSAKPLRAQLHRLAEGRAPAFKERAAIAKRIAILSGRLSS